MAEKKKHDFNLNKKKERNFDLGKEGSKRHFDLSKESDDQLVEEVSEDVTVAPVSHPTEKPAEKPTEKPTMPSSQKPAENNKRQQTKQNQPSAATNQPHQDVVIPPADFGDDEVQNLKKTNWWLYILGGCVLIALVIWLFCNMHWKAENQGQSVAQQQQQIENTSVLNEALQDESPAIEETLPDEVVTAPAENENTEVTPVNAQPVQSESSTQPSQKNQPVQPKTETVSTSPMLGANIDVETEANNVIAGKYGNGDERKAKLGQHYRAIQDRVNEKKRNGEF